MISRQKQPTLPGVAGFALIVTLIMITLVAVMVIAFLSNASLERITSKSFDERTRAEAAAQSGLAAALHALSGAPDFRYITVAGDDNKPLLIPLNYDPASGILTANTAAQRNLSSQRAGAPAATITLSTFGTPRITRPADFISLNSTNSAGAPQELERYAFFVDEAGSRQNLGVQGPAQTPTPRARAYARDPNELPLVTATTSPVPFAGSQLQAINEGRWLLFTPPTGNAVLQNSPATPGLDYPHYATASAITNLNPEGKPRVDLKRLKDYIEPLPVDQAAGNQRAALVDRLLNPAETGSEWGGGNLSILKRLDTSRYSSDKANQIVANLIDYLDSDLFPTTDNVDAPTYFGVEGKADANGNVVGHPYINFVGTGLVFNRSSASGFVGALNSTRILAVIGLVNPWTLETKDWTQFYIKPEIEISIQGTASGGNLGSAASAYFHGPAIPNPPSRAFNTTDSSNQLTSFPTPQLSNGKIPALSGFSFPTNMGSSTNYATNYDMLGTVGRQPPGMVFSNLGFKITKLRLKYTGTDGRAGYVQVLDGLNVTPQPANPSTVDMDHQGGSLVFKFANGAPDKTDFHLKTDPRRNFEASGWNLSKSAESGAAPPVPSTAVDVFSGADNANWDFTGQAPTLRNHLWYTKTDIAQDFYVKSPATDGSAPTLDSAGELGFLHTGIPWETLRMYVTSAEAATPTTKSRDREVLAYVQAGTFSAADYSTVPRAASASASPSPGIPLVTGPLNVNTNKQPTLHSLFLGASALTDTDARDRASGAQPDDDASALAAGVAANAAVRILIFPGDVLSLAAVRAITDAQTADFKRETLARRTANVLGTQSTRFTVYSVGEAREKAGPNIVTRARVNLRAEIEMRVDQNGKPVPAVLSTAYYVD